MSRIRRLSRVALAAALACGCGKAPGHAPRPSASPSGTPAESDEEPRRLVELDLSSGVSESHAGAFSAPTPTLREVLSAVRGASEDRAVGGVFVRLGPMVGAGAVADEIAAALGRLSHAGKPVHCHFENADNTSYALAASACNRITMTPGGQLALVGGSIQVVYVRSLLASLGVSADLLQVGRFKGAADPFTRDDMPDEVRASLNRLLDRRHGRLLDVVARRTGLGRDAAQRLVDEGPFDGESARVHRLIDDAEFDDEARAHAKTAAHAERVQRHALGRQTGPQSLSELLEALSSGPDEDAARAPYVALVRLEGSITDGETQRVGEARSGPFVAEMRRLADDPHCRAVVLRIDSPGGSALASDRMWHAVRRAVRRKPVVASVGGMAASGGYYVASAATTIVADRSSLVGSIGVVGGKIEISALLQRLGVSSVILSRGAHADIFFPFARFDDEERRVLGTLMQRTYERFLSRVREGRHLEGPRLAAAAEGRIFAAEDAEEAGLVDGLGGLEDAFVRARALGSVGSDTRIVEWPRRQGLFDVLGEWLGDGEAAFAPAGLFLVPRELAPVTGLVELLRSGENTYAALPYGLDVR